MSKAGGLVLILAGLGVASQVMPSGLEPRDTDPVQQTDVAKISPANGTRVATVPQDTRSGERASPPITPPKPQPAVRPTSPSARPAADPTSSPSAPVVITLARRASEPTVAPAQRTSTIPDRDSLARELQRELKRVGCYEGELNGAWTTSTRKAMKAFTDRVNATLPVDRPDYILLTLVQGHQDKACGRPCPNGQGLGQDGRCLPNALLLTQAKKAAPTPVAVAQKGGPAAVSPPTPAITGWSTTTTAVAPTMPSALPPEGRMALAGPKADPTLTGAPLTQGSRAAPPNGRLPPVGIYDRRPPPPPARYVQQPRDAGWGRALFRREDALH
jgi:hypothetical protein